MAERDPRGLPVAEELFSQVLALKLDLRRVRAQLGGADALDPARLAAELQAISEALAEFAEAVAATAATPHLAACVSVQ